MTENKRTLSYIGLAVVLLVVAGLVNRKSTIETDDTLAGKVLFPELKAPEDIAGLEIVTADDTGEPKEFRVIRGASGWTLPLQNDYPADAEKQVASAASSLIDLRVLSVVSTLPSEHAKYGVVDPEKASPGAEGVGKLIKVLDKSGNNLARLIIGRKDTQGGQNLDNRELFYVRQLPQDATYLVALPSAKFTTDFADWIETDLLKLDAWDISDVTLKDYTFDIGQDPLSGKIVKDYQQLSTMELAYNDRDAKWSLKKLLQFEKDQPKPVELAPDEELNSTKLNEMKTALDDLKIVGVRPKPASMTANLKANKSIFNDRQALQSLADRGFYAIAGENGEPEILSSDGEVMVQMKDGVEYTLRFGGVASVGSEEKSNETKEKGAEDASGKSKKDESKATSLNRFIMVSARFNKDLIPQPELEKLPEGTPKADDKAQSKSDEAKSSAETKSAGEAKSPKNEDAAKSKKTGSEAGKSTEQPQKSKKDDKSAATEKGTLHFVKLQDENADSGKGQTTTKKASPSTTKAKSPDDAKKATAGKQDAKSQPGKTDETKTTGKVSDAPKSDEAKSDTAAKTKDDGKKDGDAKAAAPSEAKKAAGTKPSPEDEENRALQRKRIETENERKQKEYDEKVKKSEARARELNDRFAGWYYVVSEVTYRKIHLNRSDVIKKKADEKKSENGKDGAASGTKPDSLDVPPLKTTDPFQKRDDAKDENSAKDE